MQTIPLIANFVSNLRAACDSSQITHAELARRSGVHRVTISRILNGHLSPTVEVCEKLAVAAGVRADTIFLLPEKTSA